MKKALVLILIATAVACATANKEKSWLSLPDFNLFKASMDSAVKFQAKEIVGLQANVTTNAKDISAVKVEMTANVEKLEAKLENTMQGIAGFNNKINSVKQEMQAGGNISQTTNDTDLMWKIIYGLMGIIGTLIGWLGYVIKSLLNTNKIVKDKDNKIEYIDKKSKFYSGKLQQIIGEGKWDDIIKEKDIAVKR